MDLLELSEAIWKGEASIEDHHPFSQSGELSEVAERTAFVASFANVSAFDTDEGLVLVDTGSPFLARAAFEAVRGWSKEPLHTAIYSHGHIDHVFGVPLYEEEAKNNGWAAPRVVAQEAVTRRFDRYVETAGLNSVINQRQFQTGVRWPTNYRYPDLTFKDTLDLDIGGCRFELHHARGETDDHVWTWVPSRRVLACGDFFIWASPNAGNPQKVPRYAREWAVALEEMANLGAEVLLPGHGLPIRGGGRVREALTDTADLLRSLHDQTVEMMNRGVRLDEVIQSVKAPEHLLAKPYLRPIYDEPEFVVRNVWRLYGGWFDGNPANLKPAPETVVAAELASLAGGASRLADRAIELAHDGDLRLACHLAEAAALAAPDDPAIHAKRAEVYEMRAAGEASVMSRGIFAWAARESRAKAGD